MLNVRYRKHRRNAPSLRSATTFFDFSTERDPFLFPSLLRTLTNEESDPPWGPLYAQRDPPEEKGRANRELTGRSNYTIIHNPLLYLSSSLPFASSSLLSSPLYHPFSLPFPSFFFLFLLISLFLLSAFSLAEEVGFIVDSSHALYAPRKTINRRSERARTTIFYPDFINSIAGQAAGGLGFF